MKSCKIGDIVFFKNKEGESLLLCNGQTIPKYKVGAIERFSGDEKALPEDWFLCNGRKLSKNAYENLSFEAKNILYLNTFPLSWNLSNPFYT